MKDKTASSSQAATGKGKNKATIGMIRTFMDALLSNKTAFLF
jgi:hypothetical protein